jgi:hypothetical protein
MTDDAPSPFSLKRWSRRKLEAARGRAAAVTPAAVTPAGIVRATVPPLGGSRAPDEALPPNHAAAAGEHGLDRSSAALESSAAPVPSSATPHTRALPRADRELPPIASLSFDSDFSAFLQPKVADALKRQALRKLFSDPRFNVMDGLDTYIDDYSIPDPISADEVRGMVQSRYIFDPPQTRINAEGHVEDVPPEEVVTLTADRADDAAAEELDSTGLVAEDNHSVVADDVNEASLSNVTGANGAPQLADARVADTVQRGDRRSAPSAPERGAATSVQHGECATSERAPSDPRQRFPR